MMDKYILDENHNAIKVDLMTWANWFENSTRYKINDRRVALTELPNGFTVSTVFLGIDHSFGEGGRPLIFESMVFIGGTYDERDMRRYSTWAEAEEGHKELVRAWSKHRNAKYSLLLERIRESGLFVKIRRFLFNPI